MFQDGQGFLGDRAIDGSRRVDGRWASQPWGEEQTKMEVCILGKNEHGCQVEMQEWDNVGEQTKVVDKV